MPWWQVQAGIGCNIDSITEHKVKREKKFLLLNLSYKSNHTKPDHLLCKRQAAGIKRGPAAPTNFYVLRNQSLSDLMLCEDALHNKTPCGNIKSNDSTWKGKCK